MAGLPRTLPEVIRRAIDGALNDVHVAIPGKVLAYNATTNLADVEVQVQHSIWDDDSGRRYEDAGTLPGVPVQWPRAGGYLLTLPLAAGDTGLLVFNSDPIGEWRSTNQKSQPDDASRLSVSWPVFVPGVFADTNQFSAADLAARQAGVVLGKDGAEQQIRIDATGIKLGASSLEHVMTAEATALMIYNALVALMAAFKATGAATATATAIGTAIQPLIAAAITSALSAQAVAAPVGTTAQNTANSTAQATIALGTTPGNTLLTAWASTLAGLSSKTPDVTGLYPSVGASVSKTE
jgi:hypothetical protein